MRILGQAAVIRLRRSQHVPLEIFDRPQTVIEGHDAVQSRMLGCLIGRRCCIHRKEPSLLVQLLIGEGVARSTRMASISLLRSKMRCFI